MALAISLARQKFYVTMTDIISVGWVFRVCSEKKNHTEFCKAFFIQKGIGG